MSVPGDGASPPRLPRYCPSCGRSLEDSDIFCPFCGRPLGPHGNPAYGRGQSYSPPSTMESVKRLGRGITLFALALLAVLVLINVIILIWSPMAVLPEAEDPAHGNTLFVIVPWSDPLRGLFEVSGASFALYHVLLVIAITASFAWMMVRSYGTLRKEATLERPRGGHSPLWTVGTIFFAVLAVNYIVTLVLLLLGEDPSTPAGMEDRPLWALLDGYASASVWEELVTRVVYIGMPLLGIELVLHRRRPLRRYFLGGGFELGGKELALIWASSGIFALAHTVYWEPWKVVPTWIAGLAFGYLFLRVGLYAAIMLHFTVDYLTIPITISGDNFLVSMVIVLIILFWAVLGAVYLVVYVNRTARFLTGKDLVPKAAPTAPVPVPMAAPGPPMVLKPPSPPRNIGPPANMATTIPRSHKEGFYSCAKCGNTKASFKDGKLECTRCGNKE